MSPWHGLSGHPESYCYPTFLSLGRNSLGPLYNHHVDCRNFSSSVSLIFDFSCEGSISGGCEVTSYEYLIGSNGRLHSKPSRSARWRA